MRYAYTIHIRYHMHSVIHVCVYYLWYAYLLCLVHILLTPVVILTLYDHLHHIYTHTGDNLSREVELIEGKGACPPEDSNGIRKGGNSWGRFLRQYIANATSKKVKESIRTIETTASNYTKDWLTGRSVPFRPLEYDIDRHRLLLSTMLAGGYIYAYLFIHIHWCLYTWTYTLYYIYAYMLY